MRQILVGVGALAALVISIVYYQSVSRMQSALQSEVLAIFHGGDTRQFIRRGVVVTPEMLRPVSVPEALRETMPWLVPATADNIAALTGRPLSRAAPNGAFLREDFFDADPGAAFDMSISADKRAIALPIDAAAGDAGLISPGAKMDVYALVGDSGAADVVPLFTDIRILAVDGHTTLADWRDAGGRAVDVVTIEATPDEIAAFLTQTEGARARLTFALRNPCAGALGALDAGCLSAATTTP